MRISALWQQKLFPASVKAGGGAMTAADVLLTAVVLGVIAIALVTDVGALVTWLRRRWR